MSATATVGTHATAAARTAGGRLGALAGLAFSFLFFMGTAMLDIPHAASDQKLVAWWSDSGHQTATVVSMYLFILAGLCFLVFLMKLRSRLLAAEGGTGELTSLVVASGAVFVALLCRRRRVARTDRIRDQGQQRIAPGSRHAPLHPQTGYAALGAGGLLAAAVAMATTSLLIVRTAVFGRWLAWVGVAAAILVVVANVALAGMLAIPAMLVWALATSVAMWRSAPR